MNPINLSIKQREQLGINYIENNDSIILPRRIPVSKNKRKDGLKSINALLENDNPFHFWKKMPSPSEIDHEINMKKLKISD